MSEGEEFNGSSRAGSGSAGLGRRAAGGVNRMVVATALGKVSSFIAQVVLGWLLSQDDFGVYGAAIGLAAFAQVVREGGATHLLVQRGSSRYEGLAGAVFWLGFTFNGLAASAILIAALSIGLSSPGGESAYSDPRFPAVLATIGLALPIAAFGSMYKARLGIDLRFKELARLRLFDALIRNGAMIVLAVAGFGPLSFAIPIVISAVFDTAYGFVKTRDRIWSRGPRFRLWPAVFARTKWLILSTLGMAMFIQGDYLVLGVLVPSTVLGVYVFAYQMTLQINYLLGGSLRLVLFPTLSKLKDEPRRLRSAIVRSTRVLSLAASVVGAGMSAVAAPAEALIWRGRWEDAVPAIQILAVFFTFRLAFNVLHSLTMSLGKFLKLSVMTGALGGGLMVSAGAGGLIGGEASTIALFVAGYFAVGVSVALMVSVRDVGIGAGELLGLVVPPWLVGLASAGFAIGLDGLIAGWLVERMAYTPAQIVRCGVSGGLCLLCVLGLTRLLMRERLAEMVDLLPGRLLRRFPRTLLVTVAGVRADGAARPAG